MASDLRLRIAGVTAMISLNGSDGQFTDAQVGNALRRVALSLGISVEGTAVENLTALLEHERDDWRRTAVAYDVRERKAISDAAIEAAAAAENSL